MLIINEKADFSTCGLGQIKYKIDADVKELLQSAYSGVTFDDIIKFQTFIDSIGGLNGTIWGKLTYAFMYTFASNIDEAKINLISGKSLSFRPTDGGTNELTCIKDEGLRLISGECFWPLIDSTRKSKPFGLIGRNLINATGNEMNQLLPTNGASYRIGGTRLYTTQTNNDHSIILSNDIIKTSIAVSFQSETDVTIVSNGVEIPNSNTTALPVSNNTSEEQTMNVHRIIGIDESISYPYQFHFIGYNLTKEETIQIADAADKMVI